MTNADSIRFTLSNGSEVTVKKMTNNKYDFELKMPNGNRKTFIWSTDATYELGDSKGKQDVSITEAVQQFSKLMNT